MLMKDNVNTYVSILLKRGVYTRNEFKLSHKPLLVIDDEMPCFVGLYTSFRFFQAYSLDVKQRIADNS